MTVKESLSNQVNSALLTDRNHSCDNSFLSVEFHSFSENLRYRLYEPYGVCKNIPYNPYPAEMIGYVFKEDDEVRWVHMSKRCWLALLTELHGTEKAKKIVEGDVINE